MTGPGTVETLLVLQPIAVDNPSPRVSRLTLGLTPFEVVCRTNVRFREPTTLP